MNNMKTFAIIFLTLCVILFSQSIFANNTMDSSLTIVISSPKSISGIAGDYASISGVISNKTDQSISDVTTYLSLVDTENKLPVDLEDWSAEKGLFIGTIDKKQTLPLLWKIHFVKAGTYSLIVIGTVAGKDKPVVSSITKFNVAPKKNLNPGHVLPVALGIPIIILIFMSLIQYRRSVKIKMK